VVAIRKIFCESKPDPSLFVSFFGISQHLIWLGSAPPAPVARAPAPIANCLHVDVSGRYVGRRCQSCQVPFIRGYVRAKLICHHYLSQSDRLVCTTALHDVPDGLLPRLQVEVESGGRGNREPTLEALSDALPMGFFLSDFMLCRVGTVQWLCKTNHLPIMPGDAERC
jgi:hypothetical protein